jgi:hypothetical protein
MDAKIGTVISKTGSVDIKPSENFSWGTVETQHDLDRAVWILCWHKVEKIESLDTKVHDEQWIEMVYLVRTQVTSQGTESRTAS